MLINKYVHTIVVVALCVYLGACATVRNGLSLTKNTKQSPIAYLRETNGFWQIWLTDMTGDKHRQLTFDAMDISRVSWGAGHQHLLANRSDGQLSMINTQTGGVQLLKLPVKGMLDAQISKDGKWIAFSLISTLKMDTNNLWRIRPDGSGLQKLTNQGELQLSPSWSAAGDKVLYTAGTSIERHEIWMLDVATGSQQQISQGRGFKLDPSIGPAGPIVYSSNVNTTDQFDLWLQDTHNDTPVQLTDTWAVESEPAWSPSGQKLAYVAIDESGNRIWVMDRNGINAHPITPFGATCRGPAWY